MAFSKKKIKLTNVAKAILFTILIMGGIGFGGYMIFNNKVNSYELELNTLKSDLIRRVYMSNNKVIAGTIISEEDFYLTEIYSSVDQNQYISQGDMGKILIIDIEPKVPIIRAMISDEIIQKDLREEELNMLLLPSNLIKNQYVDVRIGFPNGEDYIVLSKKKIQQVQLPNNTVWLWVDEKEILMLSSAIVDAYLNKGSKLYTVTYVAPTTQEKAILNYPVNKDVLEVIKNNPNILEEAKKSLSDKARNLLDERLLQISDTEFNNVESGVKEEASNRETKIAKEQQILNQDIPNVTTVPETVQDGQEFKEEEEKESDTFY